MKQSKSVKQAGPYHVTSHSQGRGIVYFQIYPAFPEYDLSEKQREGKYVDQIWKDEPHWAEHRYNGDGGGPSIFTSIGTAKALEEFLNSIYPPEQVKEWEKRIKKILDDESKDWVMAECETCGTVFTAREEHKFCSVCGKRIKKSKIPK